MVQRSRDICLPMTKITIFLFALYTLRESWLAFDKPQYSMLLTVLFSKVAYFSVLAAGYTIFVTYRGQCAKKNALLILFPITYWSMGFFLKRGSLSLTGNELAMISIVLFFLLDDTIKKKVFDLFYKIVQATNVISILMWICYQLNVNIGFQTVPYYRDNGDFYIKWFWFAIYRDTPNTVRIMDRLCGIFNEPGALGTLCALLLIVTFRHTKWWEKALLFITGMLTYSVAFLMLVFGYIAVRMLCKGGKYWLLLLALGLFFLAIPKIDWGNDALNAVAARLEITESGLAGSNRTSDEFDENYQKMKEQGTIYFGYGPDVSIGGGSSYKQYIVHFGYVGFGLILLEWLWMAYLKMRTQEDWILLLIFMVSSYQRPVPLVSILGAVIVFGGICWRRGQNEDEKMCSCEATTEAIQKGNMACI